MANDGRGAGEAGGTEAEVARRVGARPADLRRRLDRAEVVRCGRLEAELRSSELVALRPVPQWRAVADGTARARGTTSRVGEVARGAARRQEGG